MKTQEKENKSEMVDNFIRGVLVHNHYLAYKYHKKIYNLKERAIPLLSKKVQHYISDPRQVNVLTALLSLIHDLDENVSKELVLELSESISDPIIKIRIKPILDFSLSNFNMVSHKELKIFIDKKLPNPKYIHKKISQWLNNVPPEDLDHIERLFIVLDGDKNASGTYLPVLYVIMVKWQTGIQLIDSLPFLRNLGAEWVLYHEVGHHFHQHKFGYDLNHENEADQYARSMFRKTHPILVKIVTVLVNIIKALRKIIPKRT